MLLEQVEHKQVVVQDKTQGHLAKVVTVMEQMAVTAVLEAAAGMVAAALVLTVVEMMTVQELEVQDLYGVIEPQQTYVKMVTESAEQLTEEGFLLPEDAQSIILQAELTSIP